MGKVDPMQVDFYILEFMDETPDLMFAMLEAHKELQTQTSYTNYRNLLLLKK